MIVNWSGPRIGMVFQAWMSLLASRRFSISIECPCKCRVRRRVCDCFPIVGLRFRLVVRSVAWFCGSYGLFVCLGLGTILISRGFSLVARFVGDALVASAVDPLLQTVLVAVLSAFAAFRSEWLLVLVDTSALSVIARKVWWNCIR